MIPSYTIRAIAREKLAGRWRLAGLVSLVAMLLGGDNDVNSGVNFNMEGDPFSIPPLVHSGHNALAYTIIVVIIIWIIVVIFAGPAVELGHRRFYISLCRDEYVSFPLLFSRFHVFWRAWGLRFMTGLFTFLWMLLLIIPGIIAHYRYRMAMYLMADYDIGIMDAIEESKQIMHGHKFDLFFLGLTFIGWGLLCLAPLAVGAITVALMPASWLCFVFFVPFLLLTIVGYVCLCVYVNAAEAVFYLNVLAKRRESLSL